MYVVTMSFGNAKEIFVFVGVTLSEDELRPQDFKVIQYNSVLLLISCVLLVLLPGLSIPMIKIAIFGATILIPIHSLENGLARTPPMGWMSWQRFGCEVTGELVRETAEAMKDLGLLEAGYQYINIDDCWSLPRRVNGKLVPDPEKFPVDPHVNGDDGMMSVSNYVHSLGFNFGIYSDIASRTCGKYPGLLELTSDASPSTVEEASHENSDHERDMSNESTRKSFFDSEAKREDVRTWMKRETHIVDDLKQFVAWGVDSLKVDGCGIPRSKMHDLYGALSDEIMDLTKDENTRKILLSCSWPAYEERHCENEVDMRALMAKCNLWRNTFDVNDSWDAVKQITKFYARHDSNDIMTAAGGPGHWNDPDMLVIGTPGLSVSEQRAQFALWAILAAPLYISVDVREMASKYPESLKILLNKKVIAVNQDPLGKQGFVIWTNGEHEHYRIWVRRLSPAKGTNNPRFAVLFENNYYAFSGHEFHLDVKQLGWTPSEGVSYNVDDLHKEGPEAIRTFDSNQKFTVMVDVSSVEMFVLEWRGPPETVDHDKFPQDRFEKSGHVRPSWKRDLYTNDVGGRARPPKAQPRRTQVDSNIRIHPFFPNALWMFGISYEDEAEIHPADMDKPQKKEMHPADIELAHGRGG